MKFEKFEYIQLFFSKKQKCLIELLSVKEIYIQSAMKSIVIYNV